MAIQMRTDEGRLARDWSGRAGEHAFELAAAGLSFAAASIHFGVSPDHFAEYVPYGIFFAVLGWFQVAWGAAFLVRPGPALAWLGAAVNGAVVLIWVYSRAIGLPFGPEPGAREARGLADTISSLLEIALAAVVVGWVVLASGSRARRVGLSQATVAILVVAGLAVAVVASVVALSALQPAAMEG